MTHTNFYRKYRPTLFREVIGQEAIIKILQNVIIQKKLHHAYLFSGMQGVGKTSVARILASVVNCLDNQLGEACGKCHICQKNQKFSQDIIEIDAASHNGVEQIRNLRAQTMVMPSVSQHRVFIIDEVHMLSKSAFNAFLKILEEPPKHILFILATTEINKIPATILSRCQRFHFQMINSDVLTLLLEKIAKKELFIFDNDALKAIADYANGCVRDALNVLEQVAFSNFGHKITKIAVIKYFGFLDQTTQKNFIYNLLTQKNKDTFHMIEGFDKSGINFSHLTMQILEFLKNLLFQQLQKPNDEKIKIKDKTLEVLQLQKISDLIFQTLPHFRYQLKSKLIFEIMCLHILQILKNQNNINISKSKGSLFIFKTCKIPMPDLLNILKNKDPKTFSLLKLRWKSLNQYSWEVKFKDFKDLLFESTLITCSENTILLKVYNDEKRNQINNLEKNELWRTFIQEFLGKPYVIWALTNDELYNLKLNYQKQSLVDKKN